MRRSLRRAGWTLAAAGGITLAGPALGQSPPVRILGPGGHVEEAGVAGGVALALTESQARQEEGQVELAFLADPLLFSYALGAHVEGAELEVRGYVPSEAAHEQALRVARASTALHLVDKVKVFPGVTTHGTVDRPENILRAACELLRASFPEHGQAIDVTCDARGHVTVGGTVGSFEEKVLVSRKLRQVPGCSCVLNQLTVAAARPTETADRAIPDVPPVPARPAVRTSEPVPARTVAAPVNKVSDPPSLGVPRVYAGPVEPPAVKAPAPKRWVPPAPPLDVPLPPTGPTEGTLTLVPPPMPKPPSQSAAVPVPPARIPAPPSPPPPLPPTPPPPKAPVAPRPEVGGSEESYVTQGTVTFEEPAPAKPAAGSARPSSPASAEPSVGTVTLDPPPMPPSQPSAGPVRPVASPPKVPAPPAPVAPPRPTVPPAVRLKERIQGACGPAYAVKVTAVAGKNVLNVEVSGPRAGDQERLMGRIAPVLDLPEFSAFEINCDIIAPLK